MASRTQFLFKPVTKLPSLPTEQFEVANVVIPHDVIREILQILRLHDEKDTILEIAKVNKFFNKFINYFLKDEINNPLLAHLITQRSVLHINKNISNFFVSKFPRMLRENTPEAKEKRCEFFVFKGTYAAFLLGIILVGAMNFYHCGDILTADPHTYAITCTNEKYMAVIPSFFRTLMIVVLMTIPYLQMKMLLEIVDMDKEFPSRINQLTDQIYNAIDSVEFVASPKK